MKFIKGAMNKPVAVLISDIHYNLANLELADKSLRMAITTANELNVPLIVAGDLHDTKANLRGECVNAMRTTFKLSKLQPYILRGNHDAINEKSKEHSLNFLEDLATVVSEPIGLYLNTMVDLIPYHHDVAELRAYIKQCNPKEVLIMHQGIQGSNMGDYIQDRSALSIDDVAGFRVISGHYHARQTIDLPNGGKWDYIGNPYTVSYGEANDPPKGYQILMDDGSLKFMPTNLRKHIIYEPEYAVKLDVKPNDLVWVKLRGSKEELASWTKDKMAKIIGINDFRLELIPHETMTAQQQITHDTLTKPEIIDGLIDSLSNTSEDRKARLKANWKSLCE